MDNNQITGSPGKADNVFGSEKDNFLEPALSSHDMGGGENTAVEMSKMDVNRMMYERDKAVQSQYHQMPEPEVVPPDVRLPGGMMGKNP